MKPMTLEKTALSIGAEKPFKLLHVSDTHLCYANDRDDERKQKLAAKRAHAYEGPTPGCCLHYFREGCRFANEQGAILAHTGDLFDFVSEAHCDMASELLSMPNDYFMAPGNHEFSLYVGEAFEDDMYKAISFDKMQAALPRYDLRFASRVVNGVNLIAIDDVYYDFSQHALDCLKAEAAKGLPMLVFFHTPLYTPDLYETNIAISPSADLLGVPADKMQSYTDYRFRQQITTPQTQKFLDYFYQLDLVKAVFAGHLHFSYEGPLPNGVMQYVTGTQSENIARLVTVE